MFTPLDAVPRHGLVEQDGNPSKAFWRWLDMVWRFGRQIDDYSATLDPVSIAANTSAEQTFTVSGLRSTDMVLVNKPTATAGLVVGGFRVSADNTLAITFGNMTASAIDPPSETYLILAFRRA